MNKFLLFTCILFLSHTPLIIAQSFTVDDSLTAQQIIESALFQNGTCEETSNIISGVNGNINGLVSFGAFSNNSDFPLSSGIIITTGSAAAAANNSSPFVGEGDASIWSGSTDLEAALGITNTVNATEISFNFTPLTNNTQFRYVFSSDEYGDVNPQACTNRDAFAILIRPSGTAGTFTNIATLPNGSPVSVNTIHPQVNGGGTVICPAENDAFFDGIRSPSERQFPEYNGRTNVLTTDVNAFTAGVNYEIKFVIADDTDRQRDSAALIEIFNNNLELNITASDASGTNLGSSNINTCSSNITLSSTQTFPPAATFQWFQDGTPINGETNSIYTLATNTNSRFTLEVNLGTTNIGRCEISQDIDVILTTNIILNPENIQLCVPSGNTTTITLSNIDALVLSGKTATGTISYHSSEANAISNSAPLTNTYSATNGDVIYGRFSETNGCLNTKQISINIDNGTELVTSRAASDIFTICDFNTDGFESIDILELTNFYFPSLPPNTTLNYYTNPSRNIEYIDQPIQSSTLTAVLTSNNGCDSSLNIDVIINIPQGSLPTLQNIDVCDDTDGTPRDGIASFNIIPNYNSVVAQNTSISGTTVSLHSSLISAENNTNIITPSTAFRNQPGFTIEDEQTVGVRIEDANGCTVLGSFILRPRYLITTNSIVDVNQCDNTGSINDGFAEFDFTNVNNSGENIESNFIINTTHTLSIHLTEADAISGANSINTSLPFINTTAFRQELFARVMDNVSGCFDVESFNLIVSEPVTVTPVNSVLSICDTDTDGVVNGLVTFFNNNIASLINSDVNLRFSYFTTLNDAQNNTAEINDSSTNPLIDANNEVFARVSDPATSCFEITSFNYFVNRPPVVGRVPPISVCYDPNIDPSPVTDISTHFNIAIQPTIANNVTVTYYRSESQARAEVPLASDEITNETAFEILTDTNAVVWYRVIDNTTGCLSVVRQDFLINEIPTIDSSILEIVECEIAPTNNAFDFILSTRDSELLAGQANTTVTYYSTLSDANNRINPINKNQAFTNSSNPQTIAYRLERNSDFGCAITSEIDLKVGEFTAFNRPSVRQCDNNLTPGSTFDLPSIIAEINRGAADTFLVSFHASLSDAQSNINPLADISNPNTYTTDREIFDVVARVTNSVGCREFPFFQFQTFPKPEITVQDFEICDLDQNGSEIFDLISGLSVNSPLISFANTRLSSSTSINFFDSNSMDSSGRFNNPIVNPSNYRSTTPEKEIFIETETTQGCFFQTSVTLRVSPSPIISNLNIRNCEDSIGLNAFIIDVNQIQNNFEFLNPSDPEIANLTLQYFADATGNTPITGTHSSSNPLFVQATNTRTTCTTTIERVNFIVDLLPNVNTPNPSLLSICDEDGTFDGITDFNFSAKLDTEILGSSTSTNNIVTYHDIIPTTFNEPGLNNINRVTNQTYYARVSNTISECFNVIPFTIIVNTIPEIENITASIEECDINNDSSELFDLTDIENSFISTIGAETNYTVSYFNDSSRTSQITAPTNYLKSTLGLQNIYITLTSAVNSNCTFNSFFQINLNPLPQINPVSTLNFCAGETLATSDVDGITKQEKFNQNLISNNSNNQISYHTGLPTTATNEISPNTALTSGNIFVSVLNTNTSCKSTQQVTLIEVPLPVINKANLTPQQLSACDTDGTNDGKFTFNFDNLNSTILGTQNTSQFTVTYHSTLQDAENNISIPFSELIATGEYFVKVTRNDISCTTIDSINITIDTLPENEFERITFCSDDPSRIIESPNIGNNLTYLWEFQNDTGATIRPNEISQSIQLSPADIGVNVSLTIVDSSTANNCSNTKTIKVMESSSANIEMIVLKNFESEQITINVTTPGNYLYGFNDPDILNAQESNVFTNLIPGRFTIYVFDINGCEPSSQIVDFVNYFPGFTPNGSGPIETETWHIIGIESIPETLVYIYNRYGKLLKTLTSNSPGWDGTYNGAPLPSDDYWILIRLEDGTEINDHITLKR